MRLSRPFQNSTNVFRQGQASDRVSARRKCARHELIRERIICENVDLGL